MPMAMMQWAVLLQLLVTLQLLHLSAAHLQVGHYALSCPHAEGIVRRTMEQSMQRDRSIVAGVLRLHFHDCFVEGCDGSVLLDGPASEKTAAPNLSLRGFEVVDAAKADLELQCPGVVSCADILAFAARDAVELTGGLGWAVRAGRLDGRASSAARAVEQIPVPGNSVSQNAALFAHKGLSRSDMVVLLGAHTIGRAHCYNSAKACGGSGGELLSLDATTPDRFDNMYYTNVINHRGVLESDQALFSDVSTRGEVIFNSLLAAPWTFQFSRVMAQMGSIQVAFVEAEMWPESMEQMGIVRICKEAAQLLHHHFRLFLPFFLAFHLPASFLSVFHNALPHNRHIIFLNSAFTTGHEERLKDGDNVQPSFILSLVILAPMFLLTTLGVVTFTYIVDYIYSGLSGDDAATRRVFKLLPHAFLRVFETQIWVSLVLLLLTVAYGLLAYLLKALFSVVAGGSDPSPAVFFVLFVLPQVAGTFALAVVFELAHSVAVLEQENHGRKALKQSRRYARGRAGTIFGVVAFGELVKVLVHFHARAVATAGLSLATEVVAASVISVVFSVLNAYVALVGIVTYFVCKSGSKVAALPVAAAEKPHRPVVSGSTQIGEP